MSTVRVATFADLLRRQRRSAGLTQEELAAAAGLSVRAVSDLERGLRRSPHQDTVQLLADALGLGEADRAALATAAKRGRSGTAPALPVSVASPPMPRSGSTGLPLVGRAAELAHIEALLGGDGPPVLLLAGEPGIGKTRLLDEAARRGSARGWQVVAGGCTMHSGQGPFEPLLGALARALSRRLAAQRRADLQGCAWLVRLLPELAEQALVPAPAWTLPPEQERRLMFAAVARYLANVAGPAGTLLVLDDLQWAETDALDLLSTVVRAAEQPLRVVGAYRTTEVDVDDPLGVLATDLARDGLAVHAEIGPLERSAATQLLGDMLGQLAIKVVPAERQELAERVLERAGGVPFFLVSCAQAMRMGTQDEGEDGREAVPWDVAQTIRQRVAALPQTAQGVLGVAAVAGRTVTGRLLAAATGLPDGELLSAVEAACRGRLLIERDDADIENEDAYQFAHDLIREVVEADLSAARRKLLHRRVGDALEAQADAEARTGGPMVEQLAYHYGRAGVTEKALRYLERAGDKAWAAHANAEAEHHYGELVARLEGLGRALDAARVREQLGRVQITAAHNEAALETLEAAAATYRAAGELEGLRRVMAQIGEAYYWGGSALEGLARLEPLLDALQVGTVAEGGASADALPDASPGAAALYDALALLYFTTSQFDQMLHAAERASALAKATGEERLYALAETGRGFALMALHHPEEALRTAQQVVPLAERLGELKALCHSLQLIGYILGNRGELADCMRYLERALAVAEQMGDPATACLLTGNLGEGAFATGDWGQARAHFEHAARTASEVGGRMWTLVYPLLNLGGLALAEGRREAGARQVEEALVLAERDHDVQALHNGHGILAERDLVEGHPDMALARLAPLLDQPIEEPPNMTWFLALVAWAHVELGDEAQASALVERMLARSYAQYRWDCLRIAGLLALRQHRWQEAAEALEEAIAGAHAFPYLWAEAKALYVYGQMHLARGEPERAREAYQAALAICTRLGEGLYRPHIERALAELGARVGLRDREGGT
jgi:tetratricopeptide (TPR) repeat protein/transcriptional regulator with XRE-family HTH domain